MKRRGHSEQLSHREGGSRDGRAGCGKWLHWVLDHRGMCSILCTKRGGCCWANKGYWWGLWWDVNQCWCGRMNFDFLSVSSLENANWRTGERAQLEKHLPSKHKEPRSVTRTQAMYANVHLPTQIWGQGDRKTPGLCQLVWHTGQGQNKERPCLQKQCLRNKTQDHFLDSTCICTHVCLHPHMPLVTH